MYFEKIGTINYITVSGLDEASKIASNCISTISKWLPVEGSETLSTVSTMDRWHDIACKHCFEFFKFNQGYYAGPGSAAPAWWELYNSMVEIRSHYNWEEIDFENRLPYANIRGSNELQPISRRTIARAQQAVDELRDICANQNATKVQTFDDDFSSNKESKDDTKSDKRKKTQKKTARRAMNKQAIDCCRLFKADRLNLPMKTIVEDYVEKNGSGSVQSIMRVLNDNPEQWKDDTKAT
jgi:hypothetical protein